MAALSRLIAKELSSALGITDNPKFNPMFKQTDAVLRDVSNPNNSTIPKLLKSIKDWEFIYERNSYTSYLLNHFMFNSISNYSVNETLSSLDNSFFLNYINNYETIYDIIDRTQLLENHYDFSFKNYITKNLNIPLQKKTIEYFLKNLESLFKDLFDEEYEYLILLSCANFKVPSVPSLICKIISKIQDEFLLILFRQSFK